MWICAQQPAQCSHFDCTESLRLRIVRQIEATQSQMRIVGQSGAEQSEIFWHPLIASERQGANVVCTVLQCIGELLHVAPRQVERLDRNVGLSCANRLHNLFHRGSRSKRDCNDDDDDCRDCRSTCGSNKQTHCRERSGEILLHTITLHKLTRRDVRGCTRTRIGTDVRVTRPKWRSGTL